MKFEFSAGGVVFKKQNNNIEILLCQHSQHHGWVFPKGLIGDHKKGEGKSASAKSSGETKEEAALREVEEETGAKGKILEPIEPVTYWYVFDGEKIKKTVYYFVMEFIGGDITKHDFEMENVEWLPFDKVLERLTFKSDKEVFKKAMPVIQRLVG
jgi:8-oxo-dGTP pyrophosphatase MutT (NUDIX family)